ncbi:nickel-dependent hydrogenase large subunit [Thermincola ferriacetica]|uniref:Nickel-dependent hydrogenase large subunit n=1 Tax=Thermincola ferriacetica TaxID=281456 RepID=A0A0L6W2L8_9FIRM|nr:nickel-dependent hydrogenase large subunit [Thermincola ferriacetica]KNZ69716.1 nickel-dependent hydrogenase large subunit [Thermincola ferriacetica]
MNRFTVNPISTGNQPLSVELEYEGARIRSARVGIRGYWSFEKMLIGRHPFDALQVALRINSHLSVAHGLAAAKALESISGMEKTFNGMLARNILQGCEFIYYHLYHFYQGILFAYIPGPKDEDMLPGPARIPVQQSKVLIEHYWQAMHFRTRLQEMMALLAGRVPHQVTVVPGGLSETLDTRKILKLLAYLEEIKGFISNTYINDVKILMQYYPEWATTPVGQNRYLAVHSFPQKLLKSGQEKGWYWRGSSLDAVQPEDIELDDTFSWDSHGDTDKKGDKAAAYSWLKAGRYRSNVVEVGSLARAIANGRSIMMQPNERMNSVLGRELIKAGECIDLLDAIKNWINYLKPEKALAGSPLIVPKEGTGVAVVESPAGPVLHKIILEKGLIKEYLIIDPFVFNYSPKDKLGANGPVEQALIGLTVANLEYPIEIVRVLRAFE